MEQAKTMVSITNLHKSFGHTAVLGGIDLTIKAGEIFCLLGANGAGKTTLVNILSTLLKADSGSVQVGGFALPREAKNVRAIISLTGQYAAVDGFLTGRENLEMIAALRHEKHPKAVAGEMLAQFDLTDAADRQASAYSGGMRRRLDIAMSLIGKPKLLFLDEPTTGLDPQSRIAMWSLVRTLKEAGTTIFLTTQYIEEAEALADHIAILANGAIVREGSVATLLSGCPGAESLEEVFLKIVAGGKENA